MIVCKNSTVVSADIPPFSTVLTSHASAYQRMGSLQISIFLVVYTHYISGFAHVALGGRRKLIGRKPARTVTVSVQKKLCCESDSLESSTIHCIVGRQLSLFLEVDLPRSCLSEDGIAPDFNILFCVYTLNVRLCWRGLALQEKTFCLKTSCQGCHSFCSKKLSSEIESV